MFVEDINDVDILQMMEDETVERIYWARARGEDYEQELWGMEDILDRRRVLEG
jgi:hypothetical protein